jgi:outer membrane receptor protein involved in Fe transport
MRNARFLWVLLLILAATISGARAAAPPGAVEGVARDALQRPLAGVHLRLEAPDGRVLGTVNSGPGGAYHFSGVAPGVYSVVAEQEGFETATAVVSVEAGAGANADLTLASKQALDLSVVARQLEAARTSIQPRIGATTYSIPAQAIQNQPGGGENNPLNQVVLQAPGVSQDSFGQIHVRNEHANVQYRVDGVILPEGVSVFGQSLSPRIASSVDLITGALPAEYGLRTAGIVDIQTKSGAFTPGGAVGIYGGSHGWLQPSAGYGGSVGSFNYFVAGDYLQNGIGIEPPTRAYHPIHDATEQGHGFAYLEDILDATSKVSAIFGTYRGQFQIPDIPGQTPSFHANGISTFDSARLDENQREINHYGVLAYLKLTQDFDFQISSFARYSSLSFRPDDLGDLLFNGISQSAYRRSFASGVQAEAAWRIASDHTLRSGVIVTGERTTSQTTSLVLPAVGGVQVPPDTPFPIVDNAAKTGWTYSLYLQDEWRVTPTVTLNYGGRFDVVDAFTHENQLSPRINAVWKATPTTTVHAGYANYFTPPPFELVSTTSINKFIGTTAEPAVLVDNTVKAERAHYFDIGVEQQILPGLKAGIDAYYKYSRNLIDEGQFGAPIILTPFNYHYGRNLGVELTTSYEIGPFSFYGNLALAQQKAEHIISSQFNFSPDDLAFIATHPIHTDHDQFMTASAGMSYLWMDTRFSVNVLAGSGLRHDNGSAPNGGALPSYEQVNLGISHKFKIPGTGPIEVRLDLINIFDEVYKIRDGTGVGVGAPQFGPRRTVFAGIKKEF